MPRQLEEEARGQQAVYAKLEELINDLTSEVIRKDRSMGALIATGHATSQSFRNGVNHARSNLLAHLKKVVLH
ncbi:MAG: hypothetical protein OXB98_03715 [Bryobacterales bacterium]|nr:hypothetical protein [Bryobacterales bacterium]